MIEVVLLGCLIGILAGLVPGIHTNLIAVLISGAGFDAYLSCVFLVAVAISRSIADALPSVFLGASENALSILPAHRLLRKGYGREAVHLLVVGALLGLIGAMLITPVLFWLLKPAYDVLKPWIIWLVLLLVIWLVVRERNPWAFFVFIAAGIVGVVSLRSIPDPFFPMFSGFFGASGLILSLIEGSSLPRQSDVTTKVRPFTCIRPIVLALCAALLVTMLPGLGPSQGLALVQKKREKTRRYLMMTGAVGTIDVLLSLVTFVVIGRARNGAVVAIAQLIGPLNSVTLTSLIGAALLSGGIAAAVTVFLARGYARFLAKFDYSLLCGAVIFLLGILSIVFSGYIGLLVFITAASIGIVSPLAGVSRTLAMGCLILPMLIGFV